MSRRILLSALCLVSVVAAGAFFAGRATSDEPKGMPPGFEEKMKEWEKMKAVGPQHETLKAFEGSWLGKGTWTEDGISHAFTEDYTGKMVFGGRFLQMDSKMTMEAPGGMPAMTMSSTGFVGYDNAKQKYVSTHVGDMGTAIGMSEGTYDAATKTFSMTGTEAMGPGKERKFRMTFRVVSPGKWIFEMFTTPPGGTETKAGEATYKRK